MIGVSFTDGVGETHRNARQMQTLSRLESFTMKLPITAPPISANEAVTSNLPEGAGGSLGASEMKAGSVARFLALHQRHLRQFAACHYQYASDTESPLAGILHRSG